MVIHNHHIFGQCRGQGTLGIDWLTIKADFDSLKM